MAMFKHRNSMKSEALQFSQAPVTWTGDQEYCVSFWLLLIAGMRQTYFNC